MSTNSNSPHKECRHCNLNKPISEYGHNKTTKDRLQVWCRACLKEYSLAHYNKNKSKYNERRRTLWKDKKI